MPYKVKKSGDKFCVVNEDSGKQIHCHPTRAKALEQMKALYANEKAELVGKDVARGYVPIPCCEETCERAFLNFDAMIDHAGRVHYTDEARSISAKERKTMANKGQAMSDGSFPIANVQDLKNAITSWGRAKNKAAAKAHIIKRAKALGATSFLPASWKSDSAAIECPECLDRAFLTQDQFCDHAEAVHTFDDTRLIVAEGLREKFGKYGEGVDWRDSIYIYVEDIATDWVVFSANKGGESDLYKCSYSITDGVATFGAITEVKRRTVYDPVGDSEPEGVLGDPQNLSGGDS